MNNLISRITARAWAILVAVLAISGCAQMPIFKRYYIADIPGFSWTADYYFTHAMHYVAATLFMALAAWIVVSWLRRGERRLRLTAGGWLRVVLLVGVIITGALRMYKNQPGVSFSPEFTLVVDWTHLGLVILLGLAALFLRLLGKGRYAVQRR